MKINYLDYWNSEYFIQNMEINLKNIENTIDDIEFSEKKVLICGRGDTNHPKFNPCFSTPTTNLESEFYVTTDHDPKYVEYVTKPGNYVLSIIVDPLLPKKILALGGKIFWFSISEIFSKIPTLNCGKFPMLNSGLAAISLAEFLNADSILLSGIKLDGQYSQFLPGQRILFEEIKRKGIKIFSIDGILTNKLTFNEWISNSNE